MQKAKERWIWLKRDMKKQRSTVKKKEIQEVENVIWMRTEGQREKLWKIKEEIAEKQKEKQSKLNGTKTNRVDNATELYTYFMNYI
jgi:hypothetical protein